MQRSIQDVLGPYYTTFTLLCYTERHILYNLVTRCPSPTYDKYNALSCIAWLVYGKGGDR